MSLTMQVPTDYTYSSFTPIERQTTFIIIAEDPCEEALLDDFLIEDVLLNVLGPPILRDFPLQV